MAYSGCAGPRVKPKEAPPAEVEMSRIAGLARTSYDKGSLDQAETLYRRAHQRARALDLAGAIADGAFNLAAVHIAQGRVADAWPLLDEAESEWQRIGRSPVDVWLVKGRLALEAGQPTQAREWLVRVENESGSLRPPAVATAAALLRGEILCAEGAPDQARTELASARASAQPLSSGHAGADGTVGRKGCSS